jgi:hypothetical protein
MACIDAYDAYGREEYINRARALWDRLYTFQVLYPPVQGHTLVNHNNSKINGTCNGSKHVSFPSIRSMIYSNTKNPLSGVSWSVLMIVRSGL